MIINAIQKSDIQTIGDIKQIKTSIDVKNIEFITTILSSNLYSQPIKSFLREIVSNAWDSHVEAGNTKEPVIIKVESNKVSIRDYGTGLSKETFEDLYCKIGSSTKRNSNDYIGGFGIGKFSSIAVSDIVYITSYYNGIASSYIMIKENGTITTNHLGDSPTTENNGLLVSVNISDILQVKKDLTSLVFFPNIYVDYSDISISDNINVNRAKVTRYKNFSVSSILQYSNGLDYSARTERLWVLLGNVLYPLDVNKLNVDWYLYRNEIEYAKQCNICLNVEIGSINVTPNRESIIYSENTIEILSTRLKEAIKEIRDLIDALTFKDVTGIKEYSDLLFDTSYWNPIYNTIEKNGDWKVQFNVTYKGEEKEASFNDTCKRLRNTTVPGFRNIIYRGTCYTKKGVSYIVRKNSYCSCDIFYKIEDDRSISGYTKQYLMSNSDFHEVAIIKDISSSSMFTELLPTMYIGAAVDKVPKGIEEAINEWIDYIKAHTITITKKEIDDYKKAYIARNPKERRAVDNTLYNLYKYGFSDYDYRNISVKCNAKFPKIIEVLKTQGKCIINNGRDIPTTGLLKEYKLLDSLGYSILWCSNKLYVKLIKYITTRTNKKELSNVILNYKDVLYKPNKSLECKVLIGEFCNRKTELNSSMYLKDLLKVVEIIIPNYIEYKKFTDCAINTPSSVKTVYRNYCNAFGHSLVPKTIEGKALQKYIEMVDIYTNQFYNVFKKMEFRKISNNTLILYITARSMIKDKNAVNLREYVKLKRDPLIKMIYE